MLPAEPARPITASLERYLAQQASAIPDGRRGQAQATVTLEGVEFGVGTRIRKDLVVSGYAARLWGGKGWTAGARANLVW